MAPNGNGSVYAALSESGVLKTMEQQGVQVLCSFAVRRPPTQCRLTAVWQVDNVATLPIDPSAIGLQLANGQ